MLEIGGKNVEVKKQTPAHERMQRIHSPVD